MKSTKQLLKVYQSAKGDNQYYSFEDFKCNVKSFIKDVKKGNTYCGMYVSKSGMLRKFNFDKYNMILNICNHKLYSWEPVKMGGCGMDMHWYCKFNTIRDLCTKKEIEKYYLNFACSNGKVL